jgi:hypothetical protein
MVLIDGDNTNVRNWDPIAPPKKVDIACSFSITILRMAQRAGARLLSTSMIYS